MDSFFFRVEHDLLRSESFKTLGGSAIKVYLVIGLYSDFGTGWAFPSIRTIAKQAGLSRQTVLTAIAELTASGLLATQKSRGRSTAYRIIRQAPDRSKAKRSKTARGPLETGPISFELSARPIPKPLEVPPETGPKSPRQPARGLGHVGPSGGPEREPETRAERDSVPITGTPFRITGDGAVRVAVDLQDLLADQGIPPTTAARLVQRHGREDVVRVLLNVFHLRGQGKLQNAPGYIRSGLEEGYALLPQVAERLESGRREAERRRKHDEDAVDRRREQEDRIAEERRADALLATLGPERLAALIERAVAALPKPLVRSNPTLSNPFIRSKLYELAAQEPSDD